MLSYLRPVLQGAKYAPQLFKVLPKAKAAKDAAKTLASGAKAAKDANFFKKVSNYLSPAIPGQKFTAMDKLMRFGPDAVVGTIVGAQTLANPEANLLDALIAGGTATGGSLIGGLGTAGTLRHFGKGRMSNQNLANAMGLADLMGSFAGDFASMPVGDALMRVTGGGETPFERLGRKEQQKYAQELEQQLLASYGLLPGVRGDDYLRQLGLA
tara:strand:- start:771 stop:1406 length:636 start_codon:yes stop_codon:yes gene_type:complete